MNSHANAVKIGQQIAGALAAELAENNTALTYEQKYERRISARGTAYRVISNLWYDLYHVSVRARYDYTLEAYLKAIGWPD